MSKSNSTKKKKPLSDKNFGVVTSLVTVLTFFGLIMTLSLTTALSEKKDFSETENRKLASFPKFTGKTVYNGKFTSGVEDFLTDHFAGHDTWIAAKTRMELLSGKSESNGIYILSDRLVEKVKEPDETVIAKSIDGINTLASDCGLPVFMMLVPSSAEIYGDELPPNAPGLDQKAFIDSVYSRLDDSIVTLDAYSIMKNNRSDYIYYRTDHHWTSRGAFLVYNAAGKKMGYTPLTEDDFDIEHASAEFKGTFYSKVLYEGITPDTMDYWLPTMGGDVTTEITTVYGEEPAVYDSMYFRDYLSVKDKYASFLGPNVPVVTIKTGNEGGKLLMFKDSYAHCYAPFLANNYSEITLLDLRYIQTSYKNVIDINNYDQVLILYNAAGFSSDENVKRLMF